MPTSTNIVSHSYPMRNTLAASERLMSQRFTRVWTAAVNAWRTLLPKHEPRYRPEAHYMRGPGPKSRAKHTEICRQR
jgi:hypothetical protein